MIGGIVIGILDFFPELLIEDEKEKAASKAAIAAGVGAALTPLDPSAGLVGGLLAVKEGAVLAVEEEAKSGVGAAFDVAADAVTASPIGLLKKMIGGAAGGVVGAAGGDVASGLQLGASIAEGRVEKIVLRAGGAGAGAAIGAASGDERGVWIGAQIGSSIAGAAADLEIDVEGIKADAVDRGSLFESEQQVLGEKQLQEAADQAQLKARIDLVAEGASFVAAGAIYAAADANGQGDAIAALQAAHSLGAAASGFVSATESPFAAMRAVGGAAQPAASVVAEITTRARMRELEERAQRGDNAAYHELQQVKEHDRRAFLAAAGAGQSASLAADVASRHDPSKK